MKVNNFRKKEEPVIANAVTTKSMTNVSNGIYPITSGGVLKVNDYHRK